MGRKRVLQRGVIGSAVARIGGAGLGDEGIGTERATGGCLRFCWAFLVVLVIDAAGDAVRLAVSGRIGAARA